MKTWNEVLREAQTRTEAAIIDLEKTCDYVNRMGWSYQDIAAVLNVDYRTVQRMIIRARQDSPVGRFHRVEE